MSKTINIKDFGAIESIDYKNIKNPYGKSLNDYNNDKALINAVNYLVENENSRGRILVTEGVYNMNPENPIVVPNGIEVYCQGHAGLSTEVDDTFIILDGQYRTEHRFNLYYKPLDKINQAWWTINGETTQRNKKSVGLMVRNSRKIQVNVESNGFVKGIFQYGYKEGTTENTYQLGDIRNCRYGFYGDSDYGHSTQTVVRDGRIKNDGFRNYNSNYPVESAAIWVNGDGYSFENINIEGAENGYQYSIVSLKPFNILTNVRFEKSLGAGQIKAPQGITIIGGTDYNPFEKGKWGKHYGNRKGKEYVQLHTSRSFLQGEGTIFLGGAQMPTGNAVLTLQESDEKGKFIRFQQEDGRVIGEITARGFEFHGGLNDWISDGTNRSLAPLQWRESTLSAPKFTTVDKDKQHTALNAPLGVKDNHIWNDKLFNFKFKDKEKIKLSKHGATIFLDGQGTLDFDLEDANNLKGARIMLHNIGETVTLNLADQNFVLVKDKPILIGISRGYNNFPKIYKL